MAEQKTPGIRFKTDVSFYDYAYLITDVKQEPWLITGVILSPIGHQYSLSRYGYDDMVVFSGEFTLEENILLKATGQRDDD